MIAEVNIQFLDITDKICLSIAMPLKMTKRTQPLLQVGGLSRL